MEWLLTGAALVLATLAALFVAAAGRTTGEARALGLGIGAGLGVIAAATLIALAAAALA